MKAARFATLTIAMACATVPAIAKDAPDPYVPAAGKALDKGPRHAALAALQEALALCS